MVLATVNGKSVELHRVNLRQLNNWLLVACEPVASS